MGQVKETIQDLSPMASANIESGSATRWNHLKTIALVTVCVNSRDHIVEIIVTNVIGSSFLVLCRAPYSRGWRGLYSNYCNGDWRRKFNFLAVFISDHIYSGSCCSTLPSCRLVGFSIAIFNLSYTNTCNIVGAENGF
jgi:hypothetical protein